MIEEIRNRIANALRLLYNSNNEVENVDIEINRTSDKSHGDLYTNIAMKLAKIVKKNPLNIAEEIRDHITLNDKIVKIESVAPGYINFFISTKSKYDQINTILNSEDDLIQNVKKTIVSPKIIAVSKTFKIDHIMPLIDHGHLDYGENKVQEAMEKWTNIKNKNKSIKLHLIGGLQTNKVKFAVRIFDYIHSLDSKKLADKISYQLKKQNMETKIFIQVNLGKEKQKSGILEEELFDFYKYCKGLNLNIIGLMCIPPFNQDSTKYFLRMQELNKKIGLKELSMGMSADYISAIKYDSTFVRIESEIFGQRY